MVTYLSREPASAPQRWLDPPPELCIIFMDTNVRPRGAGCAFLRICHGA
jgi:hypothetical protein